MTSSTPFPVVEPDVDLPEGWLAVELGSNVYIAGRIGWRGLKAEEYTPSGPILLSVPNLNYGDHVDFSKIKHISVTRYDESPEIKLKVGDTLLVKDGAGIGKLGYVAHLPGESTVNSSLLLVRPANELLDAKYLFHYLKGPSFQEIVRRRITGSSTPHLFQRDIKRFRVLVPPLAEQKRIVEKVEQLLTCINAARERLAHVSAILEKRVATATLQVDKLSQAILAKAFRGELVPTEAELARREGRTFESAADLLSRIRSHRDEDRADKKKPIGAVRRKYAESRRGERK
jgi:type I restriction enzyme, S subunit